MIRSNVLLFERLQFQLDDGAAYVNTSYSSSSITKVKDLDKLELFLELCIEEIKKHKIAIEEDVTLGEYK